MKSRDEIIRSIIIKLIGGQCIIEFEGIWIDEILNKDLKDLYGIIENTFPFNWKNLIRQSVSRKENTFHVSYKFGLTEMRYDFKKTIDMFFQVLNNLESNEKYDNIIQELISIQQKYHLGI